MNKIRDVLLTQYIGAITIGLVFAQAVFGFVNAFVQVGATYIAIQQARKSVFERVPTFSWHNFIISIVTVSLYVLICFLLIRWLYSETESETDHPTANSSEEPQQS